MTALYLVFIMCTAADCRDGSAYVVDHFQAQDIEDAYSDCEAARKQRGVKGLACMTRAGLDEMGAGQ